MNKNKFFSILILIGMIGVGILFYKFKVVPYKEARIEAEEIKRLEAIKEANAPKITKQEIKDVELTNAQKIDDLRDKKNYYKTISLDNYSKAYFKENGNSLDLLYSKELIGNFDLVSADELRVELIKGTDNDLYIEIGDNKFFYNSLTNEAESLDLNIDVKYIKSGLEDTILIVTEKGTFVYNIFSKDLDYFSYFKDFVYYKEGYIGIILKDDLRVRRNLGYLKTEGNLIVYYNPNTKEKKILKSTYEKIEEVYILNREVYIKNKEGELFKIENI